MAKVTKQQVNPEIQEKEMELEERKVRALEKLANSLDALTIWFEEINKAEWSERIQYYLFEFLNKKNGGAATAEEAPKTSLPESDELKEFARPKRNK